MNSAFLLSLLLVNSNKILLLFSLVYLIILIKKTQNYRFSLFLLLINLLPFTIGRNIIETTLIGRSEIFSFAIFDVKYFFPIYLSDLFLVLIYQDYLSNKFFTKNQAKDRIQISKSFKIALVSLLLFLFLVLLRSINHEFNQLLILGAVIIVKYILLFATPVIVSLNHKRQTIKQIIASMTFFQTILVFVEQFRGGNIGRFIENRLPGLEFGTRSSEAIDLLRADGTFNEPNITAIFLLINSIILINFSLNNFRIAKKQSYLYLFVGLLSWFAIIFTGSRSLYGLTLLCLVFYCFKYQKVIVNLCQKILKNKILKLVSLILILSSLPYLISRTSSIKNVLSSDGSFSYRQELNNHVLAMSFKHPLGIGLDLTPYYLAKNFKTVDSQLVIFDQAPAHNIIIQILAETGIFACLIFLFFVYYVLRNTLMKKNNGFALAALVYFMAAQFHPVFTNHYELTAFFFLYMGMGLNEN